MEMKGRALFGCWAALVKPAGRNAPPVANGAVGACACCGATGRRAVGSSGVAGLRGRGAAICWSAGDWTCIDAIPNHILRNQYKIIDTAKCRSVTLHFVEHHCKHIAADRVISLHIIGYQRKLRHIASYPYISLRNIAESCAYRCMSLRVAAYP